MPGTRVIVKDPFAMLSIPEVVRVTGATTVLVYRHPAAVLASYRRMRWSPDLAEVRSLLETATGGRVVQPDGGHLGEPEAMARFWSALYRLALDDLPRCGQTTVVSHEELAVAGTRAGRLLFERLQLDWCESAERELAVCAERRRPQRGRAGHRSNRLHDLDRPPAEAASSFRRTVSSSDVERVEAEAGEVLAALDSARFVLSVSGCGPGGLDPRELPQSSVDG